SLFVAGGCLAGVAAVAPIVWTNNGNLALVVVSLGVGGLRALGVEASLVAAVHLGCLEFKPTILRSIAFVLTVTLSCPLCIIIAIETDNCLSVRQPTVAGIDTGLLVATSAYALLVSFALWLLTARWDGLVSACLIAAGLAIPVMANAIGSRWRSDVIELTTLFFLGDVLFASLCGVHVIRTTHRMPIGAGGQA
ncbi:MAG TPA: hypothetical protein VJX67_24545, partial [Blastocatellia bacterium]|nr:hypothetical protein [Blastocatellia bacterium]